MHVAKQFPVDPANQAGFDNSGESLTMSPALLNKYLKAAREVADHAVLKPDGIDFAPYPMLVETDREKYAIQRIVSFYKAQPTDYADYFEAAWRYKYRIALKKPHATLATTAVEAKVSPKYLPMVWQILHDQNAVGPVVKLQKMWLALPPPAAAQTGGLRAKMHRDARFRGENSRAHSDAVCRAGRGGFARAIRASSELEVEGICRASARQRSQGSTERHRPASRGSGDSWIS